MLARVEAGLAQQLLGLGRVVAVRLLRLAEPRMTFVDDARGGNARVVEQALADAHAIDRIVRGLAHELAVPRLLVQPQRVRPVVRIGVQRDLEARAPELRMESGGGTSIQSTWPLRSAASRVVGSGIGSSTSLSIFGRRFASQ